MNPTAVDDGLARAASRGDERALARIFDAYHQPLYRYCLSILGSPHDAEDALQETMVKVLRALPGEKREVALKPWLYRVAHNESIDLLRRRRDNVPFEESDGALTAGLAEHVETRQRLRQLIADLGALPERQRGTLLMREAGGLDFEEIAAALETTPAVARQTLYEARLGLREMEAGRDMECATVTRALSDGDRRVLRRRDIRAHLRGCDGCGRFAEEMDSRRKELAAISPLPAVAAAGILHGLLGGGAGAAASAASGTGATGGGLGGVIGGTAVKSVGTATLLKGAATLAVVAAIGVGAADKSGLLHIGHHDPTPPVRSGGPAGAGAGPNGGSQPSTGGTEASSARRATASEPSPAAGSSAARHQRSVGAARAAAPPPPEHAAVEGVEPVPEGPAGGDSAEAVAPVPLGSSSVEHPHGRSHEKQTPVSAAHGQATAAANKPLQSSGSSTASEGESGSPDTAADPAATEHPTHPTHPSHPTHPVHPAKPPKPTKPPKPSKPTKPEAAGTSPVAEEPAAEGKGKKSK